MNQMRIKQNETGRSMVEMLGVLAVVGVLSIGGVAGYRYAVDKMNANEIINELKKRAITASQQRVLGQGINLAEYGAILGKYAVGIPADGYPNNPSAFALEVKGIPEGVCNHILRSDWALPVEKKVGGTVVNNDTSCSDGANILTFAFNNTLESGNVGNGGNGEGNEGNDDPIDTPIQQCGENEYRLADGTCKEDTKCSDPNQFWNAHYNVRSCKSCPTEGKPVQNESSDIEDSCSKCSNAQQGNILGNTYCVYCPSDREVCGDMCCEKGKMCQYKNDSSTNWELVYTCVDRLVDNECLTNADCNKNGKTGEYCKNAPGCTQMIGTCEEAKLYNSNIDLNGISLYRSQEGVEGWYAAQNFCEANNMSLLDLRNYCSDTEIANKSCSVLAANDSNWYGWTATASGTCMAYTVNIGSNYFNYTDIIYSHSERHALCVGDASYVPPVVSTEVTTQTETTTVTDNVYQICDPSGHCTPCSDTSVQGVPFSDKEMCENKCNSTGYTWIYHGEYDYDGSQKGNVCSPCLGPISDIEDNIEAVCARCNRGVDWTSQYGNTYQCAPVGSGSIGSNPNATVTETVTETVTVTETETEQGMRDEYGYFHSCSETGYFSVNDTSECSKCEGSGYLWGVMGYNCVSCQGNYISDTEDDIEALCAQCNKGVDWANGWGSNPKYYACSSTSAHNGEKPAKDCFNVERTKECIPCDSLEGVGADDSPNCSACGELRTSRSGNCFLTTCPAGYIHAGSVFASNGSVLFDNYTSCVPCPTVGTRVFVSDLVDTFGAECQACNGRLDGSYCYME